MMTFTHLRIFVLDVSIGNKCLIVLVLRNGRRTIYQNIFSHSFHSVNKVFHLISVPELADTNVLGQYTLEMPNQSPQHAVPSPGSHGDSSNQGLYSPLHPGSTGTSSADMTNIYNNVLQVTFMSPPSRGVE